MDNPISLYLPGYICSHSCSVYPIHRKNDFKMYDVFQKWLGTGCFEMVLKSLEKTVLEIYNQQGCKMLFSNQKQNCC